jgi:hypothetical protein
VRRLLPIAFVVSLLAAETLPAAAQSPGGRCAERFPGSVFDSEALAGPVVVYGSGLDPQLTTRYAADFEPTATAVQEEMGGLEGVVVCIFAEDIPVDGQALGWPEGQRLHAVAFGEEGIVVLSSYLIHVVPDAGRAGLLHVAMWQISAGTYPEPFGSDITGWYNNRANDQVEVVHSQFVRANIGLSEPWPPFPWTVGRMVDPLLWNPEFGYGGNGDFTNYAVAIAGDSVLSDPLGSDLEALDAGWRQELFDESGSVLGGSRAWIKGLIMVIVLIIAGILMAWWGRHTRKRLERELREAVARDRRPIVPRPEEGPVRPSDPGGGRRGDARVGGGRTLSVVVEKDHGDGSPPLREVGTAVDDVPAPRQSGDDLFRPPGFDDEV